MRLPYEYKLCLFDSSDKRVVHPQSTNPLPFPLIFANCVAWVSYAYVKQDIFVFLANDFGILFGFFFTLSAYGVANPSVSC